MKTDTINRDQAIAQLRSLGLPLDTLESLDSQELADLVTLCRVIADAIRENDSIFTLDTDDDD